MITDKQVKKMPQRPGVYIFRSADNEPLYVGKAVKLRNRVKSYLRKDLDLGKRTQKMIEKIKKIEHIETESEIEALLLEAYLIKRLKPEFNVRLKDDKAYKYIKITTNEEFPRVLTSRRLKKDKAKYFGPFPAGKTVNEVMKTLRKMFPYCNERTKTGKPCFYVHLQLCPGPCANLVSKTKYRKNIHHLILFLNGKKKKIIKQLEGEMKECIRLENFEKAAQIRDKIRRIEYITQHFRDSSAYIENPNLLKDIRREEIKELIGTLSMHKILPKTALKKRKYRIEAYDISCISGEMATGSMVVFVDGQQDSGNYRRFRIRSRKKIDDLTAMKEVLTRRFKRLSPKSQQKITNDSSFSIMPDLVLIDGGKGQLNTALRTLEELYLNIPTIALAKRLEEIILPEGKKLRLPKRSKALQLLMRIRDESHRFAKSYHLKLRKGGVTL